MNVCSSRRFSLSSVAFVLAIGAAIPLTILGCGGGGSVSGGGGSTTGGSGGGSASTLAISSISPSKVTAGSGALTLTVSGSGFLSTSVVEVGGSAETTSYVRATQLTATVPATQLASGANLAVAVSNGVQSSGSATQLEVDNPAPTITAVSPGSELLGAASPALAVTGTGFVPTTVISVNGTARTTTFTSSMQVRAALTAADVAALGSLSLTAVNATPGGGTSSAFNVPVNNPPVGSIQLSPSVLAVGGTSPVTITVTGSAFLSTSVIEVDGSPRATMYVNASTLTFMATVADQADSGFFNVTVVNPAPGGGASPVAFLTVGSGTPPPVVTSVTPNTFIAGSPDTTITVRATGFMSGSVVQWNGTNLVTSLNLYGGGLYAIVPAADLTTAGTASVTVDTPISTPSISAPVTVTIINPPVPTLTSVYPNAGPINTAAAVTLNGTDFTANTTVSVNGVVVPSQLVGSTQIKATIPASSLLPGNASISVTTAAPGGGTSAALAYTAYLGITNNDIVYNPTDGLLYASVPVSGIGRGGNSVVGIDPVTGSVKRTIWVGSNPDKLALSSDGTQLFVGLDGAAAVAQVNLTTSAVVNQFSLGGGPGVYNPPYTAKYLAAVPGSPNSVAVVTAGNGVTIYDSGTARTNHYSAAGAGPVSFGSSASTLYLAGSNLEQLTVDATGISAATNLGTIANFPNWVQYDNGKIYLSTGAVLNASTGALLGTFYSTASTAASGPVVSDSTLGRAFIGETSFSNSGQILAFDESTFNQLGSIPVNGVGASGYPTSFQKIVRWGQNGIALSAVASAFSSTNQIFIFHSPLVKDLSSSPADISVQLTAPAAGTTGTAASWIAIISNAGPNSAEGAALALNLDSTLIVNSVTASQGSCGTGASFTCNVGMLASGASATVTVSATPTNAGTLAGKASVDATSYDPALANNQSTTTSTAVTGSLYGAVPMVASISPNMVQAGSADFTLTVTGTGFNENSTVNFNVTPLPTAYVSPTQVTATVSASEIASYGWAAITVSNPLPGGGVSQIQPLTIYDVVSVPANGLLFDQYSQMLYATVPSTATNLTGNSVVTIDPTTGTVGTPVNVGSEPTVMAETSDGNYLYIGLKGADSLAQFDLLHHSLTATIPLALTQYSSTSSVAASWLATMPGSDSTLAINTVSTWGNFGIFDVSGNTGSFRPNLSSIYSGVNPVFADASHVYAFDSQTSGAEFYRYSIDANGLNLIDGTTLDGIGGFMGGIQLANGLVYGAGGGIANPSTTPPSQVAVLPTVDFYQDGISDSGVGEVADPSLQKEFLMEENAAGTWEYALVRYDLTRYMPEALVGMPATASSVNANWTMLRFGQDGLALLSSAMDYSTNQPTVVVMLLRGPFVAPQELETNSAASLSSSSAATLAHGSGNTILTLTGSNFLPGVAVTWNGSYRTTTIVDATHVTVAVPASDLASSGTASLVATNPGASASNALTITIN